MKTFIVYWTEKRFPNKKNHIVVQAINAAFAHERWEIRAQLTRSKCKTFEIVEV